MFFCFSIVVPLIGNLCRVLLALLAATHRASVIFSPRSKLICVLSCQKFRYLCDAVQLFTKQHTIYGNTAKFFKIISLNVRGLRSLKKRKAIFLWLEKQKSDIIFLQETYSTFEDENIWRTQWKGKLFFSHGSNHSKGR